MEISQYVSYSEKGSRLSEKPLLHQFPVSALCTVALCFCKAHLFSTQSHQVCSFSV